MIHLRAMEPVGGPESEAGSVFDAVAAAHPAVFALGAFAAVLLAFAVWRSGRRKARQDVFSLLGTDPKAARKRTASAPVDLSKPIKGETDWRAIRGHARDAAYQRAVETVRNRYAVVSNPMLLPNTLRTTMDRWGLSFRDAMLRVAEDDGLR
jgi:hypothetical protein